MIEQLEDRRLFAFVASVSPISGTDYQLNLTGSTGNDQGLSDSCMVELNGDAKIVRYYNPSTLAWVTPPQDIANVVIDGRAGDDTISVSYYRTPTINSIPTAVTIIGDTGDDHISSSVRDVTTDAGGDDDVVTIGGGSVTDHVFADLGEGDDEFYANGNADGGKYSHSVLGSGGNDIIDCSSAGGLGTSGGGWFIAGGSGIDQIAGSDGEDDISGGMDYDVIYGLGGDDYVTTWGDGVEDYADGGGQSGDTIDFDYSFCTDDIHSFSVTYPH
jgi:hypothetical protein